MYKDTLITSSGIIKNRFKPRVGVINANSLYDDLLQDCINDGIDLSFETYSADRIAELKLKFPELDDTEIDDKFSQDSDMLEFNSHIYLLGAWVKDANGQYTIDKTGKNGSFALEYNTETGTVCVEWSTLTTMCNNTSPCYVMADGTGPCGNLDSKGSAVIAYTLPNDMLRDNDNE